MVGSVWIASGRFPAQHFSAPGRWQLVGSLHHGCDGFGFALPILQRERVAYCSEAESGWSVGNSDEECEVVIATILRCRLSRHCMLARSAGINVITCKYV